MNREDAVHELKAVYNILKNDVDEIFEYGESKNTHFAHRTMLRTHFAFIEGMVYQLRQVALASSTQKPNLFSPQEIAILKEESYELNKKGEIQSQDNFQKFLPSLLFSMKCYARIHGTEYKPNTNDHRWSDMRNYYEIRNQLIHPKSSADLNIDNEKVEISSNATNWFYNSLRELFHTCEEADKKYTKEK